MLAKNVNDNALFLNERGACEFFASKLAPTKSIRACPLLHLDLNKPRVNRTQAKGPLNQRAFLLICASDQNLNTSISVRIGVAIGIFGFCGSAGLAWAGACFRGASAIGGWLAKGLRATDNCCANCCNSTPWA